MNGATAEPWVRTISVPKSSITTRIGKSQNFFRSLMKAHNSRINSPIGIPPSARTDSSCAIEAVVAV